MLLLWESLIYIWTLTNTSLAISDVACWHKDKHHWYCCSRLRKPLEQRCDSNLFLAGQVEQDPPLMCREKLFQFSLCSLPLNDQLLTYVLTDVQEQDKFSLLNGICSLNVHISGLTLVKQIWLGIRSSEDFLLSSLAAFYK